MEEMIPGISAEALQEFMESLPSGFCLECGDSVYQNPKGRRKRFCSDACRIAWNSKHPRPENWKSGRAAICPVCGKKFTAIRESKRQRKYCSHACANRGRAAERRNDGEREARDAGNDREARDNGEVS